MGMCSQPFAVGSKINIYYNPGKDAAIFATVASTQLATQVDHDDARPDSANFGDVREADAEPTGQAGFARQC